MTPIAGACVSAADYLTTAKGVGVLDQQPTVQTTYIGGGDSRFQTVHNEGHMKDHHRKKSEKLLRVGCLSACLVTAWGSQNYLYGQSAPSNPVPEPSTVTLVASGVAGLALLHKKKPRK